jgi:hypothetical protein
VRLEAALAVLEGGEEINDRIGQNRLNVPLFKKPLESDKRSTIDQQTAEMTAERGLEVGGALNLKVRSECRYTQRRIEDLRLSVKEGIGEELLEDGFESNSSSGEMRVRWVVQQLWCMDRENRAAGIRNEELQRELTRHFKGNVQSFRYRKRPETPHQVGCEVYECIPNFGTRGKANESGQVV